MSKAGLVLHWAIDPSREHRQPIVLEYQKAYKSFFSRGLRITPLLCQSRLSCLWYAGCSGIPLAAGVEDWKGDGRHRDGPGVGAGLDARVAPHNGRQGHD